MIQTEHDLIAHLNKYYKPKALVLAGSRVSGKFSSTSDWDVYVFTDESYNPESADSSESSIDVAVVPLSLPEKPFETRYHPEQYLKIIHNDIGASLEEAVENNKLRYQAGPGPLDPREYTRQKRLMKKISRK